MKPEYEDLCLLREKNPAWKLLRADSAPFVADFLTKVFIDSNDRELDEPTLLERLEDELFVLRERFGTERFPRTAADYVSDWSEPDRGWLRRFYANGGDEPFYDLTPSAESALVWIASLTKNSFVGTESRLKMIFDLLQQTVHGAEEDPAARIAALEKKKSDIESEIARIKSGEIVMLDDVAIKDRFQQFSSMARELLTDFREVEYNFRALDRDVRRKIAVSTAGKGEILDDVLGKSDSIEDSDQGRSFRAFTEFLLSPATRAEFNKMLKQLFTLEAVKETKYDERLERISDSWLAANDHTMATMRQLSAQLRQFLDGRVWLENRRITEILQSVSRRALEIESEPQGAFMEIDVPGVEINLMMERPLFAPVKKAAVESEAVALAEEAGENGALFEQFYVDKELLAENIRRALIGRPQATLGDVLAAFPAERGLAEIVAYMSIASESEDAYIDSEAEEKLTWHGDDGTIREARAPRIVFINRNGGSADGRAG